MKEAPRLTAFVARRGALVVALAALAIRLVWNLRVHPLLDYSYSDMSGYLGRAARMFNPSSKPDPVSTFFPYGTHFLVYGIQRVFGRQNGAALGSVYAALGAVAVLFTHLSAQRVFRGRVWLPFAIGAILAAWVPWIKMGGFVLSEPPLAAAIAASTWLTLRLHDEGRRRDALALGIVYALGATFRPQLLASAALLGVFAFFSRRDWAAKRVAVALVAVPIAVVLALSAGRTHRETKHWGTISTNGAFNLALGRCHPVELVAAKTPHAGFTPPSFNGLAHYEEKHGMRPVLPLDPAFGEKLSYDGEVWDERAAIDLAKKCAAKTGPFRQAKYSLTHVVLLWAYNGPWPASAGTVTAIFAILDGVIFLPGLLLGLGFLVRRRETRAALVAVHVAALIITAMIFFGEARLRLPYDGVIAIVAAYGHDEAYPVVASWIGRWRDRRRERARNEGPAPSGTTPSSARSSSTDRSHIFSNLIGGRNLAAAPRR